MATRDSTFRLKTESNPSGIDDVSEAFDRAEKAAKKLADPNLSPRELQRAVIATALATDHLKDAMAAASKNGESFGTAATASVTRLETAMNKANVQAAKMRDTAADLKVKGDQAAQGFEKMTQFGGSATQMMQGLADTSNGLVGGFGKLALGAIGVAEAFKVGFEIGEKVRAGWKTLFGTEMPSLTNWFVKLGTGVDDATGKFDKHGVVSRSLISKYNDLREAIGQTDAAIRKLIPSWSAQNDAITKGTTFAKLLDEELKNIVKIGGSVSKFAREHADDIVNVLAPALKSGALAYGDLSREMKLAISAALDGAKAGEKERESLEKTTKAIHEKFDAELLAASRKVENSQKEVEASRVAIDAIYRERDAKIKALNEMDLSQDEYSKRKKKIVQDSAADVEKATEAEEKSLGEAEIAQEELTKKVDAAATAFREADEAAKKNAEALETVKKAVNDYNTGAEAAAKAAKGVGNSFDESVPAFDNYRKQLRDTRSEIDKTTAALHLMRKAALDAAGADDGIPEGAGGDAPGGIPL